MKSRLILLFTRDNDFAQSVREAISATGAVVLIARETSATDCRLFVNAAVSSITL